MGTVERIFHRYDYLCRYYASKIIISKNSAIEKDDLIQELRLRLFSSIKTYSKKFSEYEKTGSCKPIPLQFYLKTVMINRTKDLMKEVNSENFNLSIQSSGVNFGSDVKSYSFESYNLIVDGQNLLDMFFGEEKVIMKLLIIKNFDSKEVIKKYKGSLDVKEVIRSGMGKLKCRLQSQIESVNEFHYFEIEK
jgi:hypothetical protein